MHDQRKGSCNYEYVLIGRIVIYKFFDIKNLDEKIVAEYLPLMTDAKRERLLSVADPLTASRILVSEMLARQCLTKLCDAPEFAFQLLIRPDEKSAVTNFDAKISVVTCNEFVACCASKNNVGISVLKPAEFSFNDAQKMLSDSEIRYLFSESRQSLSDIIKNDICDERDVVKKYAMLLSLKKAYHHAAGKVIMNNMSKVNFDISEDKVRCADDNYSVQLFAYSEEMNLAYSIVERCKL